MAENYLNKPVITQIRELDDVANSRVKIKITVSAKSTSYYGPAPTSSAIILQGPGGYHRFWGFPEASNWKASWGKPNAQYLKNEGYYTFSKYGRLQGMLKPRTYSWEEWVSIPWDGKSRQRTKSVKAAQIYTGSHKNFKTITSDATPVSLPEIPIPEITDAYKSVDDKDQQAQRQIHIYAKHTNYKDPNNQDYYTSYLINTATGQKVTGGLYSTENGITSRHWMINVTEDMYQKTLSFEIQVVGKDNYVYKRQPITTEVIAPDGVGLWFKNGESEYPKITNVDFKNNSHKEVKEVWVYIDGKWRKTKK